MKREFHIFLTSLMFFTRIPIPSFKNYDEKFGARPLRRAIEESIEGKIADGILARDYEKGTILKVVLKKGEIEIVKNNAE